MSAIKLARLKLLVVSDLPKAKLDEGVRRIHWAGPRMTALGDPIRAAYKKIEIGDLLLFVFILALTRQCLWPIRNNLLAWALSFSIALSLWFFGLTKKEQPSREEGLSYSFYLIVALPLFVVYAIRFVFPDYSFDVLNYHLLFAEKSLRGWPSGASDFFPSLNPLPDMVTGIYRHLLGYRLGTIVNYLNLIWVATILVKFLRAYFKRTWAVYLAVLLILLTETMLFEINNYMVDLMALPLLLQATYLVLYVKEPREIGYTQFHIAFLLGMSIALKLTSVFFVIPILLVWAQLWIVGRFKLRPVLLSLLLLVFIAPLIPYSIHLHREGSAVVPFLDNVVESPLAFTRLKEPRWGPIGLQQAVIWPVLLYLKPARVSELLVYAGKIPLGFVLAFFFLPFKRVDRNIRHLSFVMILGGLLWSSTSGYPRYASYLEVISGMLIIYSSHFVAESLNLRNSLRRPLSLFPWAVLVLLSTFSLYYVSRLEWSLRPTLFNNPRAYLKETRFLFRDYSLKSFLASDKASLFDDVGVWVGSNTLTSSFEGLLRPDLPEISLPRHLTPESRNRLRKQIQNAGTRRMISLTHMDHLGDTVDFIGRRGLGIGRITYVSIPYYSYRTLYDMALIEVLPLPADGAQSTSALSYAKGPLPAEAFQADIVLRNPPTSLEAGSIATMYLIVRNISPVVWPGPHGKTGWYPYKINLGNHWFESNGRLLLGDDGRVDLPFDLKPDEEVELPLTITTPLTPGNYTIEFDLVQEQVAWFSTMKSKALRINVRVE